MSKNIKLQFKHQPFQEEAIMNVANCFKGQPNFRDVDYMIDPGRHKDETERMAMIGYMNAPLSLSPESILKKINKVQKGNGFENISKQLDRQYNLIVEMETGTVKYDVVSDYGELYDKIFG